MANGTSVTRPRTKAPIGPLGPAKKSARLNRHRRQNRWEVRRPTEDVVALAGHYVLTSWRRVPVVWARWFDYTAVPTAACLILVWLHWPVIWPLTAVSLVWVSFRLWLTHGAPRRFQHYELHPWARAGETRRNVHRAQRKLAKHVYPTPKVDQADHKPHVTLIAGTLPMGIKPEDFEHMWSTLSSAYRAPVRVTSPKPGRFLVSVQHKDLLAQETPWTRPRSLHPDFIPIGVDRDGHQVTAPLPGMAWLVAGVRGAGKSAFLNGLCANLVALEHCELYIIDPVEGIDLGVWHPFAVKVAESEDAGIDLLHEFNELRKDRIRQMKAGGLQKAVIGPDYPLRVLVIDELADMVDHDERAQKLRAIWTLRSLTAKGRKSLDVVIAATQDPRADILPPRIRAQFTHTLGLRARTSEQTNIVFGPGSKNTLGIDLSSISPAHQGRGYWYDGDTMTELRTPGLWGAALKREVKALTPTRREPVVNVVLPGTTTFSEPHIDVTLSQSLTPETHESALSPSEVRERVLETVRAAGRMGVTKQAVAEKLDVAESRIYTALKFWRTRELIRTDGTRWYPVEAGS